MSGSDSNTDTFHVFLCHNSEDKPEVREIASKLRSQGLKPWLDERDILPGEPWQEALEEQIKTVKAAAIFVGDNGIGQWQKDEIQAFLEQAKKRRCIIIPVILSSATRTPEFPILLQIRQQVDLRNTGTDHYDRLKKVITGERPVDQVAGETVLLTPLDHADKLDQAYKEGRRLYPALARPPDQEQRTQLRFLLNHVQNHWVEGVLKKSLHHEDSITLGKEVKEKAVEPPWKYVAPLPSALRELLLHHRNITTLFDATGLLLILGEPGSGKTTTLLELAKGLIARAKDDPTERVPIVLNLSSWGQAQSLEEWIAAELSAKYRVPKSIASAWVAQDYLVPLLDGLDELPKTLQSACVAAINAFVKRCQPSGLVVCSRLAEYEWLSERLTLNGAVCIEPLRPEDVNQFIESRGPQLVGLKQAMSNDPVLWELSQTPLMLDIMTVACVGVSKEALITNEADSFKTHQQHIFQLYVDRMFERNESASSPFAKEQIIGWLSWLARTMKKQSQSIFMIEELQPRWLSSAVDRLFYEVVASLSIALVYMLLPSLIGESIYSFSLVKGIAVGLCFFLGCRSSSPVTNGFTCGFIGVIVGELYLYGGVSEEMWSELYFILLFGLAGLWNYGLAIGLIGGIGIGSLTEIRAVESIRWQWKQFWVKTIVGFKTGLVGGLISGLLLGLFTEAHIGYIGFSEGWFRSALFFGLGAGAYCSLIGGLVWGLIRGHCDVVKGDKITPNQGMMLSLKNGLIALLISWLGSGLLFVTILSTTGSNNPQAQVIKLRIVLFMAAVVGLCAGLNRGGSAVVKHYALRLILWRTGSTPLQFIPFLDYCAKLILLKRVGGGYIFIHRTLLEYFAGLPSQTPKTSSLEK